MLLVEFHETERVAHGGRIQGDDRCRPSRRAVNRGPTVSTGRVVLIVIGAALLVFVAARVLSIW